MQRKTIDEYINEMIRMKARAALPEQQKKGEFPEVIKLGFETPSDIRNDTVEEDFSAKNSAQPPADRPGSQSANSSLMIKLGHETPFDLENGTEEEDFSGRNEPVGQAVISLQPNVPVNMPAEEPLLSESDAARERFDSKEETERRISEDEKYDIPDQPKEKPAPHGSGKLIVNVTTGEGLFPVEGATVIISDTEQAGGSETASAVTDISGKTPQISLAAPVRQNSLAPDQNGDARARYNITVMAPGYVTTVVEGVSVFDRVTSIQKIDMLTESASNGSSAPRVIEEDTVYRL